MGRISLPGLHDEGYSKQSDSDPVDLSEQRSSYTEQSLTGISPVYFSERHPGPFGSGVEQTGEVRMVEGMNDERGVVNYQVARVSGFDPAAGETPWNDGTLTILATTTNLTYTDNGYNNLPMGWYAYAVRAKYTNDEYSVWAYSNLVPRLLDVAVTINVTCCNGATPDMAEVTLTARNYPFTNYFAVTDETGVVVFDSVFKGFYDLKVEKVGFQIYLEEDIYTFANWSRDVVLARTPMHRATLLLTRSLR